MQSELDPKLKGDTPHDYLKSEWKYQTFLP
jgi:hypothetical protein